jgi:2-oxoisovalerate dehydrogenase E1 component
VPVGALAALESDDRVVATYRGHGWAIAAGVPLDGLMAEICQRAGGVNGGRGGSPYASAPEHRFFGENSIVGAGLPIADGLALAAQLQGTGRVVAVSFGDGATNQGAAHEAIVMAIARRLPVIFVCENNEWSEMTPISAIVPGDRLATRAGAYGLPAAVVDGTDPLAVQAAVATAAARARAGEGPTFLECRVVRLLGHYNADVEHYRGTAERAADRARDPLPQARAELRAQHVGDGLVTAAEADADADVDAAARAALASPQPDPATAADHVVGTAAPAAASSPTAATTTLTYAKAVTEALRRELAERPETIVFGEDIAIPGGVFGVTRGLRDEFGGARVFDTPIAEAAILGTAVGAALDGCRPIAEIMWGDFLLVALDQLVNQAANVRYLHRGRLTAPLVVRCQQGVAPGSCAQHSQSVEALLAHVPGLRVGLPGTAQDAYAMLRAAAADDDPCVLFESRVLYQRKGDVALDAPLEPVGGARLRRSGDDLVILTWGQVQRAALEAADELSRDGISAAVLDLRWLAPLDDAAIARLVAHTNRVLVVHEANVTGGFGAELVARIAERHFDDLDAPPARLGAPDVRFPSAPSLQDALLPGARAVADAARTVLA